LLTSKSDEPPPSRSMSSYYQTIEGVSCDRAIIEACTKAVAGRGDGRVSLDDAKLVFEKVKDGGKVTKAEAWTVRYCLTEFNFTEAACDWITEAVSSMTQWDSKEFAKETSNVSHYEQVDGVQCDHGVIEACRKAMKTGRVSKDDAKAVLAELLDGGKVTTKEKWTLRLCLSEFNWTEAAHDWIIDELKAAGAPIKRPAGSAAHAPAPKKARDGMSGKLKSIEKALKVAQKKDVPAEVTTLLGSMLVHCLSTYKDERHTFQSEVVDMASKVLADSSNALEAEVAKAQELVDGGAGEKDRREKAVAEAEAAYTASQEDAKVKEEDKKAKAEAYKAAVAPLKAAKDAQKTGDAEGLALEKEKDALESAVQSDLNPMKDAGGKQRQLDRLSKALTRAGLEDSLIQCAHLPLGKAPDQRGIFDGVVLKNIEEAIAEKLAKLSNEIEAFGPAKEERAAKVKAAQEAHDAAKDASDSSAEALTEAKKAEASAKEAATAAKKSAMSLDSDLANAAKSLEETKEELSNFQSGPLAAFDELKDRKVPQPEPEEPAEVAEAPATEQQ